MTLAHVKFEIGRHVINLCTRNSHFIANRFFNFLRNIWYVVQYKIHQLTYGKMNSQNLLLILVFHSRPCWANAQGKCQLLRLH